MKTSCEGILYPVDALSVLKTSFSSSTCTCEKNIIEVPHASWQVAKEQYDALFSKLGQGYDRVFVLGPLHKGKIGYDDAFTLYSPEDGELCGSDWSLKLSVPTELSSLITQNDDICSEEHSLEVIAPYLAYLFPDVPVTYVLAPEKDDKIRTFMEILGKSFPNALIFISNNSSKCCANMWKEAIAP